VSKMGIVGIIYNKTIWVAILSWAIAQILKIILTFFQQDKLDLSRIYGSGGMPSSHTSLVMALSFSLGKTYGFDSAYFAIAIVLAMVVMYDAAGVRRAAGKQAELLNFLLHHHETAPKEQLKELLGHTPIEVIAGAVLGIAVGLLC
jgi:acid phosphatase family membrane protein YuiD